jgi:hypothetical protein
MQLPADLREGWYWVRWAGGETQAVEVEQWHGWWQAYVPGNDYPLRLMPEHITALEPVAPPSWEKPDA